MLLGRSSIAHKGSLTYESFKSDIINGAKGDRKGVPNDLKVDKCTRRPKNPRTIPKAPRIADSIRKVHLNIDIGSV